ncbi:MAG: DUF1553 domain-containing protein [Pirellula sp.]|jgi:hypothetical protein
MRLIASVIGLWSVAATVSLHADDSISYNRDIRPLLSDRCFACHGPDEGKREGNLRLDLADDPLGPFRTAESSNSVDDTKGNSQAIKPGHPDQSEVWKRISTDDLSIQMPPPESGKKALTPEQRDLFRRWIEQGAKYEKFWSFEPLRSQTHPSVEHPNLASNRIDQFVVASLKKHGLEPQPSADKRTLIRRVTFDLTGLPPTREEIAQFESDDSPDAYEKMVDRLLGSSQYGEHWARHWLDLVRFADTNGMHHDHYRELSQYRDWVIRAFNANMPFDQFTTEQLAGDLLENASIDQQIASGYNRLHMVMDKGTNPPQESYTRNVVDQVSAFGTVFMGMTLECAVCHDHKYDPVKQKDFYQLFAFFNNIDGDPETPGREQQPPLIRLPSPEQSRSLGEFDSQLASAKSIVDQLKQKLNEATAAKTASEEEVKALTSQLKEKEEELRRIQSARDELQREIPLALVMKERAELRPAYILKRGAYDQPGDEVTRNSPSFLPPIESSGTVLTRLDLARWITDKRHPLMARVTVNRFWQQLFGVGLVKTSGDFGAQGEYPKHPELLDDLANTFIDSGWNVKSLIRSIVTSQTYKQSSRVSPEDYINDPENRMLARGSRIRLDSEVIRDQVLAIGGLLNSEMYGKSVKPPQPADLWRTVSMVSSSTYSFKEDTGDKIYRRSFYTFWKRAMPPPQMTIFDAPTRESCTSRRERTNTPVQALLMMNESQYFQAARHFAMTLLKSQTQAGDSYQAAPSQVGDSNRLRIAFESITGQLPSDTEISDLLHGLNSFREIYREDVEAARAMTADQSSTVSISTGSTLSDATLRTDSDRIELAALTMVVNALFSLDTAKTRE